MSILHHNDGSVTNDVSRRERDPVVWQSDFTESLLEDAGHIEQTYRTAAQDGRLAKAEADIVRGILASEHQYATAGQKMEAVFARISSILSTLDGVSKHGALAQKSIDQCELAADCD